MVVFIPFKFALTYQTLPRNLPRSFRGVKGTFCELVSINLFVSASAGLPRASCFKKPRKVASRGDSCARPPKQNQTTMCSTSFASTEMRRLQGGRYGGEDEDENDDLLRDEEEGDVPRTCLRLFRAACRLSCCAFKDIRPLNFSQAANLLLHGMANFLVMLFTSPGSGPDCSRVCCLS